MTTILPILFLCLDTRGLGASGKKEKKERKKKKILRGAARGRTHLLPFFWVVVFN
jgi:hypothetical protein